jgi:hypothetical protein
MKAITKIFLILLGAAVFACGFALWAGNSPIVDDYRWIHQQRDTESDLVAAFATALRLNHPAAYDMIDPSLKPRLDKWMNIHRDQKCTYQSLSFWIGSGTREGYRVSFNCGGEDKWIYFDINNVVIRDMKVIDWE